ncbi:hypothetical protein BH24ACT12_BH24ACT12_03330 [soil metagenome]
MFTGSDWSLFPLSNPGIISIPFGFFMGWLGTVTSSEPESEERYPELEVRALTGAGAEVAVKHSPARMSDGVPMPIGWPQRTPSPTCERAWRPPSGR